MMSDDLGTCGDDLASLLEGLVIKMVLPTQLIHHVHFCVAEVHGCDGSVKPHGWEDGGRVTGCLHALNRQAVINLREETLRSGCMFQHLKNTSLKNGFGSEAIYDLSTQE